MRYNFIKVLNNKVFLYLGSRYAVYGLQFISLMLVAAKMEPYEYGIWGFVLMLISYFSTFNFGIANSLNVLMVQSKTDSKRQKDYVSSSLVAISLLVALVFIIALIYSRVNIGIFTKYEIGYLFYLVCIIACLDYINRLFSNIYRVYNRILELSIYQSSIPVFIFISVLIFKGHWLLNALVYSYVLAQILSFCIFVLRGGIPFGGKPTFKGVWEVLNKGIYLFLYNACFYFILISISFIISKYYTVSEYGLYTFSYSFGHAVLMLLEAFSFLVFPKLIDKLYSKDILIVKSTLLSIRNNYVCLSHGLMYFAMCFFPIFVSLFPKYTNGLVALCITSLSILLSTNSFGYNSLLIARNKEKLASFLSFSALFINIVVAIVFAKSSLPYWSVPLAMIISYLLFAVACSYSSLPLINEERSFLKVLRLIMPISLAIPYMTGLIISFLELYWLSSLPFLFFMTLNKKNVSIIYQTIKRVYNNSAFIDIK